MQQISVDQVFDEVCKVYEQRRFQQSRARQQAV
jgi:hypothetical protein